MMNPTIAKARQKERQRERRERIAVEILGKLLVSQRHWITPTGETVTSADEYANLAVKFTDKLTERLDKDA